MYQPKVVEQNIQDNIKQPIIVQEDVQDVQNLVLDIADPVVTRIYSWRIIRKYLRFSLLGESYNRILEEPNIEPLNYDKALHDKDAKCELML